MTKLIVHSQQPWTELLRLSRERPGMFLGAPHNNLLPNSVKAPLRLVMETEAFTNPSGARLSVCPHQYQWSFECGPIRPEIDSLVRWRENDILFSAIASCWMGVRALAKKWTDPFQSNTNHFSSFTLNLYFANQGILAIRNREGIWWQAYQEGWPVTPPMLVRNLESPVGLMIACSLSKTWFEDLPFDLASVKAKMPDELKSRVQIDWHDKDSIFKKDFRIDKSKHALERWLL